MASRVNAACAEQADVVKDEPHKDVDDCSEIDSCKPRNVESVECTSGSKVFSKQNMDGNGDVKPEKPGKDVTSAAGKGSSGSKSPDNEVFIPAPPPATNAWTKRMQVSQSVVKSAGESANVDDKHATARSLPESNKPTAAQKQSPNSTPTDHSPKSEPQSSSSLRLQDTVHAKNTPTISASSSKQHSAENVANSSSSSKHTAEAQPKHASEESQKADAQVKSSTSAVSDTAPGGCWKKPVTATHVQSACSASVAQGSPASKQLPADQSAGELFCF